MCHTLNDSLQTGMQTGMDCVHQSPDIWLLGVLAGFGFVVAFILALANSGDDDHE